MRVKTAWVTGATGFWGRNVVLSLLRLNWRVVALSRSQPEDLLAWARASSGGALLTQGRELIWQHFDLQNSELLGELSDPPAALFHCAAIFDDNLDAMLRVNVLAPIRLIESVLPQMQAAGEGRVGIFLGQNGRVGLPGIGHFSATQGAMWTWAEAQSRALKSQKGVSVSLVFPPRAPSQLQGQLANKLSKKVKISTRPNADSLVKGVLLGHQRVGRLPLLAAISTVGFCLCGSATSVSRCSEYSTYPPPPAK